MAFICMHQDRNLRGVDIAKLFKACFEKDLTLTNNSRPALCQAYPSIITRCKQKYGHWMDIAQESVWWTPEPTSGKEKMRMDKGRLRAAKEKKRKEEKKAAKKKGRKEKEQDDERRAEEQLQVFAR